MGLIPTAVPPTKAPAASSIGKHRALLTGQERERSSRIASQCTSFITNTLFMTQIMLAAAFTALSAYKNSNRVTLTVLGALNTVLAGKAKAQDEYQALLLEIEVAERSFLDVNNTSSSTDPSSGPRRLDPRAEKDRLQKLYDTARADQQANYPDLYVSTAGSTVGASGRAGAAGAAAGAVGGKEAKDSSKELEEPKLETLKVQSEMVAKVEAMMAKLEAKIDVVVAEVEKSDAKA